MSKYPNLHNSGDDESFPHDESGPSYREICLFMVQHKIAHDKIFPNSWLSMSVGNPICQAASIGHLPLVKFLIAGGANPHSQISAGKRHGDNRDNVVILAVQNNHLDVVQYLVNEHKVNLLQTGFFGSNCMSNFVSHHSRSTDTKMLDYLFEQLGPCPKGLDSSMYKEFGLTRQETLFQFYIEAFKKCCSEFGDGNCNETYFQWFIEKAGMLEYASGICHETSMAAIRFCSINFLRTMCQDWKISMIPTATETLHGRTCLHKAVSSGDIVKVRCLVEELGMLPTESSWKQWRQFGFASESRQDVFRILIDASKTNEIKAYILLKMSCLLDMIPVFGIGMLVCDYAT